MATFDDKAIIDRLITNNGHYEENWRTDPGADPPVLRITEYTNAWGNTAWGVCYPTDTIDRYAPSEYVRNPKILFEHAAHSDCNDPAGRGR